jgi:hypothetical protein
MLGANQSLSAGAESQRVAAFFFTGHQPTPPAPAARQRRVIGMAVFRKKPPDPRLPRAGGSATRSGSRVPDSGAAAAAQRTAVGGSAPPRYAPAPVEVFAQDRHGRSEASPRHLHRFERATQAPRK